MADFMRYINYIKKVRGGVNAIAEKEHISILYLLFDSTFCLIRHGCLITQYCKGHFYKLPEFMRKRAFTQRRVEHVINKYNSGGGTHILEDKHEFNAFFPDYVKRSWLYAKTASYKEFSALYNKGPKIFIKPLDAMEGDGVYAIATKTRKAEDVFNELHGREMIIEEAIIQHPALDLGNASVNSARLLTVLDTKGEAHIVRAGLRAGIGDSVVDNYSAGGVLYEIDIETGIIDHKGIQGDNYDIIFHPGTNICMLGYQLPNWDIAIKAVKESAEKLPSCRFIGWDVSFTESGVELIEGNHNPGIFTLESLGAPGAYKEVMDILKQ